MQNMRVEGAEYPKMFTSAVNDLLLKLVSFLKGVFQDDRLEIIGPSLQENTPKLHGFSMVGGGDAYHFCVNLKSKRYCYFVKIHGEDRVDSHAVSLLMASFECVANWLVSLECLIDSSGLESSEKKYVFNRILNSYLSSFDRAIPLSFLYYVMNVEMVNNEATGCMESHDTCSFSKEYIKLIFDLSMELSARRIENKDVYTGFIFHKDIGSLYNNSIDTLKLSTSVKFGDFKKIKSLIPMTNGKDVFFNVTNGKITHVFRTRREVSEISRNLYGGGKNFSDKPLIVSIQGNGNVAFLRGGMGGNDIILQIKNNMILYKDYRYLESKLLEYFSGKIEHHILLVKWILSMPLMKKGATVIIVDNVVDRKKFVKCTSVDADGQNFDNEDSYLHMLNSMTNPDGAVVVDTNFKIIYVGALLPMRRVRANSSEGSRHHSMRSFIEKNNCIGVTISEDGEVTICDRDITLKC